MVGNYIKISLRNGKRHSGYSLLNIAGLAVGMACFILIVVYITFELSYDRFHHHAPEIYRIATSGNVGGASIEIATVPAPMGPTLVDEYPEIINSVRFRTSSNTILRYGDKSFGESGLLYADNSLFEIFSFPLISGDPTSALKAPYSMVLTQELAQKYFGDDDPIGKIINMNNEEQFTVTGVVAHPPSNSHIQFDLLASFETLYKRNPDDMIWIGWNYQTYLQLREGVDPGEIERTFDSFNSKYIGAVMSAFGGKISNYLQPLTSIHLHSHLEAELTANSDIRYIYVFIAIAVFILLIACINFTNLSTAYSAYRAKEVGLRKVAGAERSMLVNQFLSESMLFALISALCAAALAWLALPYFNHLAGREMNLHFLANVWSLIGFTGIVCITGFLAGCYPALILSSFSPAEVLKGKLIKGIKNSRLRSMLVIFQFIISITLIIGTTIVFNQLNYMRNKRLGFNKEQLLVVPVRDDEIRHKLALIKTELGESEGVVSVSGSLMVPGEDFFNVNPFFPEGMEDDQSILMQSFSIDEAFLSTYGIELSAGRNFSREMSTDQESAILINETAARKLGWENPVGKIIFQLTSPEDFAEKQALTVIGVIQDIHHRSAHYLIEPTIITYSPGYAYKVSIKLATENVPHTLQAIKEKWLALAPDDPFDYFFFDDYYDGLYRSEERLGNIFQAFALLAILIGCLGLFGLVSFAAEKRTKEIGIRKVLGSSSPSIMFLLCREFVILVGLANVFAWPITYIAMHTWLRTFPYQTHIRLLNFIIAGLSALVIALLTVSYRAYKAAHINPVEALRYE